MAEIKDLQVKLISLVHKGANNKTIIYKNENFSELLRVNFTKSSEEGIVYGIVYAPDEVDAQGDFANKDEIKKAAFEFMKGGAGYRVDVNHNMLEADAFICESWIVKSKDEFFDEVGAWAVGIKIEDENLKEMVKNGEITGLSMYGAGVVKIKSVSEIVKESLTSFFKDFKKETKMGESVKNENLSSDESENKVKKEDKSEDFKAEIKALKDEIATLKSSIEELKNSSKQDKEVKKDDITFSKGVL
ncbi:MAG: XkdF-like putative serine protease domain-containing protein [Campylobacter sp.]|nr:XkdF-like putative serine protease domain-containing protein [Campylobacter sp.]